MQSAMVENTLQELFHSPTYSLPPKVVAYLTYHFVGMDQAIHTLQILRKQRIRTRLLIDDEVFRFLGKKEIVRRTEIDDWITLQSVEKTADFDHLFLPILSFSLVTNIIELNDHNPFIRLILQALFSGKKVSAFSIGMNPKHPIWAENGLAGGSPSLKNKLQTQLNKLKDFGVHLLEPDDAQNFFKYQPEQKKRVYTTKDIEQLLQLNKKELIIDQHTIMTPLAKDILKKHQINLIRK